MTTQSGNFGATGAIDDAAATSGDGTVIAILKAMRTSLSSMVTAVVAAVAGDVANDGVDSGNPVKMGAQARSTEPTAVANADRVNLLATTLGKLVTLPYAIAASLVSGVTADITDTTATNVVAGVASLRLFITKITVQNSHASVSTWVDIIEETSGTRLDTVYCAAVGGGATLTYVSPLVVPTAAKALQVKAITTGANIRASASGYTAP